MHDIRRLGEEYEDELSIEERTAFREMLEAVTMFGPVREYVKVLYIQWGLVKLSRAILYAAIPALIVAGEWSFSSIRARSPGRSSDSKPCSWL